jgi:hypothetical protein
MPMPSSRIRISNSLSKAEGGAAEPMGDSNCAEREPTAAPAPEPPEAGRRVRSSTADADDDDGAGATFCDDVPIGAAVSSWASDEPGVPVPGADSCRTVTLIVPCSVN